MTDKAPTYIDHILAVLLIALIGLTQTRYGVIAAIPLIVFLGIYLWRRGI